jgi:hypothetical protein
MVPEDREAAILLPQLNIMVAGEGPGASFGVLSISQSRSTRSVMCPSESRI